MLLAAQTLYRDTSDLAQSKYKILFLFVHALISSGAKILIHINMHMNSASSLWRKYHTYSLFKRAAQSRTFT